jgi:hypothetical protein
MAAPAIPPIRRGLMGTGLAPGKLHRPAWCRLAPADGAVIDAPSDLALDLRISSSASLTA